MSTFELIICGAHGLQTIRHAAPSVEIAKAHVCAAAFLPVSAVQSARVVPPLEITPAFLPLRPTANNP